MNEILNKFLLTGDKFINEMDFRQPPLNKSGFTYIACRPFTKYKKWIQEFKERKGWRYIFPEKN